MFGFKRGPESNSAELVYGEPGKEADRLFKIWKDADRWPDNFSSLEVAKAFNRLLQDAEYQASSEDALIIRKKLERYYYDENDKSILRFDSPGQVVKFFEDLPNIAKILGRQFELPKDAVIAPPTNRAFRTRPRVPATEALATNPIQNSTIPQPKQTTKLDQSELTFLSEEIDDTQPIVDQHATTVLLVPKSSEGEQDIKNVPT